MSVKLYFLWILKLIIDLLFIQPRGLYVVKGSTVLSPSPAIATDGESLTLTCSYNGSKTVYGYSWQLRQSTVAVIVVPACTPFDNPGPPDPSMYEYACPDSKRSIFTVKQISNVNNGSRWQCAASVPQYEYSNYVTITVQVTVAVKSVRLTPPSDLVVENIETSFTCETSACRPAANVSWYKEADNGQRLDINMKVSSTAEAEGDLEKTISILKYTPSRNDSGYNVYCIAINIPGKIPVTSSTFMFDVKYSPDGPPKIQDYANGTTYKLIENNQGRLSCTINGGNPTATLTWNCFNTVSFPVIIDATVTRTVTWNASRGQDRSCTCQSSHPVAGTHFVSIYVNVLYPPTPPTFRINSIQVSGTVKVIRNNQLSVSCISSGNPPPSYIWTDSNMTTINGQVLSVSNVQNNGKYTCHVQNSMIPTVGGAVSGSNSSSIDVLMLFPPMIGELKNTSVVEGSPVTVSCPVTVGYPPQTTYEWIRNGTVWKRTQMFSIATARNDAMFYTCKVSNRMQQTGEQPVSQPNTKSFYLNIWYKASITSFFIEGHRGQTHVTVDENDGGIQFTCEVDSNPSSTVKILLDGEILKERSNTKNISLTHSSVACLDGGEYTCEGNNQYGQLSKKSIKLFVNCSPRPLHQIRQNTTSVLYVPVTLSFTALAYPQPGTKGFVWFRENGATWAPVLSNADLHISSSASQSNLTIRNVSKADFGRYRLTVTNDLGSYVHYLFLEEDVAENGENYERHSAKETENTALITGISLGVVVVVLAIYAASITILYKRKTKSKDKESVVKESTQKTYMNIAYKPNVQENQNDDGTTGAESDEARQYTDLVGYSAMIDNI